MTLHGTYRTDIPAASLQPNSMYPKKHSAVYFVSTIKGAFGALQQSARCRKTDVIGEHGEWSLHWIAA
jgi:hypothetical protein